MLHAACVGFQAQVSCFKNELLHLAAAATAQTRTLSQQLRQLEPSPDCLFSGLAEAVAAKQQRLGANWGRTSLVAPLPALQQQQPQQQPQPASLIVVSPRAPK